MSEPIKRGRGRPPSKRTIEAREARREFDESTKSEKVAYLDTPELQAYAVELNKEVLDGSNASLASSRASYVFHNSPSPQHNLAQTKQRAQRIEAIVLTLKGASEKEKSLSAVALAALFHTREPDKYGLRTWAEYIREARKLTPPNS